MVFITVLTSLLVMTDMHILHSILMDKSTAKGEEVSLEQNLLYKVLFTNNYNNGRSIILDIDECEWRDFCDHGCINLVGSYNCTCRSGYYLDGTYRCLGT